MNQGVAVLIKNYKIVNQDDWLRYLSTKKDGWQLLVIEKPQDKITLQQHRYYRGVVLPALQKAIHEAGAGMWPADDIHEEMKERYGVRKFILGGKREVIKSMADYTKDNYSEYLELLRAYLYDRFEIILPEPEDYDSGDDMETKIVNTFDGEEV